MIYSIFGVVLGLFFFYATIQAYILGLKHGKQLVNKEIPIVKSPIAKIKEIKREHENTLIEKEAIKTEKIYQDGFNKMMSYTGDVEDAENY